MGATDEVRALKSSLQQPDAWRAWPVTIGLLLALVAGVVAVVSYALSATNTVQQIAQRAAQSHNEAVGAHGDIREQVRELRRELDARTARLQEQIDQLRGRQILRGR